MWAESGTIQIKRIYKYQVLRPNSSTLLRNSGLTECRTKKHALQRYNPRKAFGERLGIIKSKNQISLVTNSRL